MNHPDTKTRRRKYRLNKKKFALVLLAAGCIAAVGVMVASSLEEAADFEEMEMRTGSLNETSDPAAAGQNQSGMPEQSDIPEPAGVLSGYTILVDAGHGGFDPGAIGVAGTHEADLNLAVARLLRDALAGCGADVDMTREDDSGLGSSQEESLGQRRRIIERVDADIVISIHMNIFEQDPDVCGPVVLFMPGSELGKALAEAVQDSMNDALGASGIARSQSLYILKSGNMPCVLVECGYISNADDERKLQQPAYQQQVAQAVCEGVIRYFSMKGQ